MSKYDPSTSVKTTGTFDVHDVDDAAVTAPALSRSCQVLSTDANCLSTVSTRLA